MYKVIIITIALSLSGCSTMGNLIPPSKQSAVTLEPTDVFSDLKSLPKPAGRLTISHFLKLEWSLRSL